MSRLDRNLEQSQTQLPAAGPPSLGAVKRCSVHPGSEPVAPMEFKGIENAKKATKRQVSIPNCSEPINSDASSKLSKHSQKHIKNR